MRILSIYLLFQIGNPEHCLAWPGMAQKPNTQTGREVCAQRMAPCASRGSEGVFQLLRGHDSAMLLIHRTWLGADCAMMVMAGEWRLPSTQICFPETGHLICILGHGQQLTA